MRGGLIALAMLGCGGGGESHRADGGADESADAARLQPDGAVLEGGTVDITTYIPPLQAPLEWLAVQDGDGPWQVLESSDGTYSFEATSGRYGIAHVCLSTPTEITIFHATRNDTRHVTRSCAGTEGEPTGKVETTVSDLEADEIAVMHVHGSSSGALHAGDPSTYGYLPAGLHDMLVARYQVGNSVAEGFGIIRDIEVVDDQLTDVVVSAPELVTPFATGTFSIDVPSQVFVSYFARNGITAVFPPSSATSYNAVPLAALESDELHSLQFRSADDSDHPRYLETWFHAPQDIEVSMPPKFDPVVSAVVTDPFVRLVATFDAVPGASGYSFSAWQGNHLRERWDTTAAYLGDAAVIQWVEPDFSNLEGWQPEWTFEDNVEISLWSTAAWVDGIEPMWQNYYGQYPDLTPPPKGAWDGNTVKLSTKEEDFTP